jgi:hypothetical protein
MEWMHNFLSWLYMERYQPVLSFKLATRAEYFDDYMGSFNLI